MKNLAKKQKFIKEEDYYLDLHAIVMFAHFKLSTTKRRTSALKPNFIHVTMPFMDP